MSEEGKIKMEIDPTFLQVGLDQDFYPAQPYNTPAILDFGRTVDLEIERLLDIGCGDGQLLRFLKSRNDTVKYFGLTSPGSLSNLPPSDLEIVDGDLHSLPWPDNYFDIVTARHVLEHSIAPTLALREISRVLKPGGTLHAVMPDSSSEWIADWEDHYSVLTPHNWRKLFSDVGLIEKSFEQSTWLASHSMAAEIEYRFILQKGHKEKILEFTSLSEASNFEDEHRGNSNLDYKIIVLLHSHLLFRTIEPLINFYKEDVLIVIPSFSDPVWNQMSLETQVLLDSEGWKNKLSSHIDNELYCNVLLSPYSYEGSFPVRANWRGRFMYGLAKDVWNFSAKNNLPFDFVFTLGPIDDSFISGYTQTIHVGSMKSLPISMEKNHSDKPVLLYLPTYGEESNLAKLDELLNALKVDYTLRVKFHHGSKYLDKVAIEQLNDKDVLIIDSTLSTLEAIDNADVVLADVSGAIADAVSLRKPVVIFDTHQKYSKDALLGFLLSHELAWRAKSVSQILELIPKALVENPRAREKAYEGIFWSTGITAVDTAKKFLDQLFDESDLNVTRSLHSRKQSRLKLMGLIRESEIHQSVTNTIIESHAVQLNKVLEDYREMQARLSTLKIQKDTNEIEYAKLAADRNEIRELMNFAIEQKLAFESEVQQLTLALESVYHSRSYRLFAPWRYLRRKLNGHVSKT